MLSLIKQLFTVLLSLSESLTTKCLFLNDESCVVRPTLIDMDPVVELEYYPFMISLNKCTGNCNVLTPKICVPKETKYVNVKAFNMIANKIEAKPMAEHISCDCRCKFNTTTLNSEQKWNNKTCQCECKNYRKCKKGYNWNPGICICENSKHLKSIVDTSLTDCDEIIIVMDTVSTKKTNTIATKKTTIIATNVTSTASINYHSEKVRDCDILHTVLLVIILILIIIIICYYYAKQEGITQNGK